MSNDNFRYDNVDELEFSSLVGKTFVYINIDEDKEWILFTTDNGDRFVQYHSQNCCETVDIDDIVGDVNDLIGNPILVAEVVTDESSPKEHDGYKDESSTWTFYKLATIKGHVDIKWYGSSNGYYSETVTFGKYTSAL